MYERKYCIIIYGTQNSKNLKTNGQHMYYFHIFFYFFTEDLNEIAQHNLYDLNNIKCTLALFFSSNGASILEPFNHT